LGDDNELTEVRGVDLQNQGWSLALSPNGRNIATGLQDGSVETFDAESGRRLVRFGAQSGPLSDVAFSMDGETIATAGEDGTIRLFSATTGAEELVLQGHLYLVSSMEFSAAGGSSCPRAPTGPCGSGRWTSTTCSASLRTTSPEV
jgi:WD40 repeat protein